MEWLGSNWIWLALGVGALALFVFGRAGCGMGHGGHNHNRRAEGRDRVDPSRETTAPPLLAPATKVGVGDRGSSSIGHAHAVPHVHEGVRPLDQAGHENGGRQAGSSRHRHGC